MQQRRLALRIKRIDEGQEYLSGGTSFNIVDLLIAEDFFSGSSLTSVMDVYTRYKLKGMSEKIKRARIWGPSSKFGGQVIGLDHVLKDKDIIEFQTK